MFGIFRTELLIGLLGLLFAVAIGCGGGGGSLPPGETGKVKGKVTYNGAPVPVGWTIVFMHDETSQTGTGTVETDGSFTLLMQGGSKILAGDYKVCLTPPAPGDTDGDAAAAMEKAMAGQSDAAAAIPVKFHKYGTSELTFNVKPGDNEANFDLED
ncbi:MAG: hypothetical protein CMJ64_16260 [Planctomycetaceae bacterium]|nr:hypothetical protein [Planctomycetaceae bacterium]